MKMRARVMPDLETGGGGIVDPDFLSADVRSRMLLALARSHLSESAQKSLISFCCDYLQMLELHDVAGAQQRNQILSVAQEARRLLASIGRLGKPAREALTAHIDELVYVTAPTIELDTEVRSQVQAPGGSLLKSAWVWADALEQSCEYAAGKFVIDRQSKPMQQAARGVVAMIAREIRDHTGTLPPKNDASWFAEFVNVAGEIVGLEMGPRIIASGVELVDQR